ncbi:MAG: hypothetical protein GTN78_04280, partial [Gemmatimonadales bacterium]|nr:hypothetical protein [Gemmatimonadales bacterium]
LPGRYDVTLKGFSADNQVWDINTKVPTDPFSNEEGPAYFYGSQLNQPFGGGGADIPRYVTLKPIDVSGRDDVTLAVALAAGHDGQWENPPDYLQIQLDLDYDGNPQNFDVDQTIADFRNFAGNGMLRLGASGPELFPAFEDFMFTLPSGATNLGIRFGAYSTGGDEDFGIDNVRLLELRRMMLGDTGVLVTASSTLNPVTFGGADFGQLTMRQGILTTTGAQAGISFAGTTIPADATGVVGFDPQVPTDYGQIDVNGASVTIAKGGSSTWTLEAAPTGIENIEWQVQGGTLKVLGVEPLGGRPVTLSGGTILIQPAIGDVVPNDLRERFYYQMGTLGTGHLTDLGLGQGLAAATPLLEQLYSDGGFMPLDFDQAGGQWSARTGG